MNLSYKIFESLPDEAREIRTTVFVVEQGFNEEFDTDDHHAIHIAVYDEHNAIGTSRIIYSKKHNCYCIGRVAVLKEYRMKNVGRYLMDITEKEIIKRYGHINIGVSSQMRVAKFYEKLGYLKTNDTYLDEGCPHIWMTKDL